MMHTRVSQRTMARAWRRWTAPAAVGAAAMLGAAGIVSAQDQPIRGSAALRGQVAIDGSSTVYPISEAAAAQFRNYFPNVSVTVGISGTGGGFKRFVKGEIDISDASRSIKWDELEQCRSNGVSFLELPVAYDGLSIVVNPQNTWVDQLTIEQIKQIFSAESTPTSWKQVNPAWPDVPIRIYAPGTDSGTFDYFKEVVLHAGGAFRSDMSTSEDDNVLVTGVAGEKGAIGFFGAAYYFNNQDRLKAVPIVNPASGQAVLPTPANVESGAYAPFSRPLFIYVNTQSLRRPEVKAFVEFYLEHAGRLAQQVEYVSLPQELYDRARKHYEDRLAGTHYWLADGRPRAGSLASVYTAQNRLEAP